MPIKTLNIKQPTNNNNNLHIYNAYIADSPNNANEYSLYISGCYYCDDTIAPFSFNQAIYDTHTDFIIKNPTGFASNLTNHLHGTILHTFITTDTCTGFTRDISGFNYELPENELLPFLNNVSNELTIQILSYITNLKIGSV